MFEVGEDGDRLVEDDIAVDERRHLPSWIEGEVLGGLERCGRVRQDAVGVAECLVLEGELDAPCVGAAMHDAKLDGHA